MQSCFLCFDNCVSQNTEKRNQTLKMILLTINSTYHDHLKFYCFLSGFPSYIAKIEGQGKNIMVGTVVKANIGELEEEVREYNPRRTRKEFTGVVKGVSGRRKFLARFHNGCKKNLSSNQLTVVIVEKILVEEEPEVSKIPDIPEYQLELEKGYYSCVYVMIQLKKEVGVESKEEQVDM